MSRPFKTVIFSTATTALALLVLYVVAELLVFPLWLPRLSYAYRGRLNFPESVLTQSTKAGRLPKNYIALFGDSYAVGLGDEWESLPRTTNQPFASARIYFESLHRDVVSFGRAGAGSVTGWVAAPAAVFAYLDKTALYKLEPPSVILAYFYEGNDLRENLYEFQRYEARLPAESRAAALRTLAGAEHSILEEAPASWRDNFPFARYLRAALPRPGYDQGDRPPPPRTQATHQPNRILLDGREIEIPGALQGPDTGLSDAQVTRGLKVMRLSLEALRLGFPTARIVVVYIPAPLSCYRLAGPSADTEDQGRASSTVAAALIAARSALMTRAVATAAHELNLEFVDTGTSLRAAAELKPVHGPKDWRHFNREGYVAMTRPVLTLLQTKAPGLVAP